MRAYSLGLDKINKENRGMLVLIITAMALFLNQSSIISGVNFSLADFFCVISLILLLSRNQIRFPLIPTIFFMILSASVLFVSIFYISGRFSYYVEASKVLTEYIKLLLVYIYFVVGYSMGHRNLSERIIKWYSIGGALIGTLGILSAVLNISSLSELMFYGGFRFKGLMNDPNYFSIIQTSAIVYFSRNRNIKKSLKITTLIVIGISVILTGSKTGVITLLCYLIFRVFEYLLSTKKKRNIFTLQVVLLTLSISFFILFIYLGVFKSLINYADDKVPSFARVKYIFTNIDSAVSMNGSGRSAAWTGGVEMIKMSPLIGIGIGTYSGLAEKYYGIKTIAHNTYLQLFSEWGSILAAIFFAYVFFLLGKASLESKKTHDEMHVLLRDIIMIFLIGSFAISLNNARTFWLFLGAILCLEKHIFKSNKKMETNYILN